MTKLKRCLLLLNSAVMLSFLPGAAQTRYEWVPGSRQARAVPANGASQYANQSQVQRQSAPHAIQPRWMIQQQWAQQQNQMQPQASASAASTATQSVRQSPANKNVTAIGTKKYIHFVDTVAVDGMQRQFQVHVPPAYDRLKPMPVVLIFHGLHMNGTMMVGATGFNAIADRNNFIAVYGEAVNGRWNDGHTGTGVDDVAYVSALLDKLATVVNIDRRRIYACGISNGGFFSQVLACTLTDKIAAAGVVASTMMKQTQTLMQSNKAMPIVFFLGTDDSLLPWADGRTKDIGKLGEVLGLSGIGSIDSGLVQTYGGLMTVPQALNFWTSHNGCSGTTSTTQEPDRDPKDGTRVKKEVYGSSGNEVVLYTIEGGGHSWPGCPNLKSISSISGNISQDIDASSLMWDFFKTHSR